MDRAVREAKKECVVLDSAIKTADADAAEQLSHDFQQASIKLKRRETQLSEFIDKTGRTRLNGREQSPGFNRSVSSKAVWANKKEHEFQQILAIAGKSATIELSPSMEDYIANKPFNEIQELVGKLSDKAARKWYIANDGKIAATIDKSLSLEEQAHIAFERRNANRTAARDLMADQDKRRLLDLKEPNKTFEELLKHKMEDKHLTYEEALQDIITTTSKTRPTVNTSLGLEEK